MKWAEQWDRPIFPLSSSFNGGGSKMQAGLMNGRVRKEIKNPTFFTWTDVCVYNTWYSETWVKTVVNVDEIFVLHISPRSCLQFFFLNTYIFQVAFARFM